MPLSLNALFPSISKILSVLQSGDVEQFPKRKNINMLIEETGISADSVTYVLSILAILGFIEIGEDDDVIISSKYSNIAISALRERFDLLIPVTQNLRDEEKKTYLRAFTNSLEHVRNELHGEDIPIHSRKIVNIIIKGKQIKNWQHQDVFLHIFHPDWQQYHLIGYGDRGESSIDALAHKTMKQRLHLDPIDYEIDPVLQPPAIEYVAISKSQGALTHYTIYTRVIRKLNLDLNEHLASKVIGKDRVTSKTFKWFSVKEVNQKDAPDAEIMQSTKRVLNNLNLSQIPVMVVKATRFESPRLLDIKIFSDLPNRIDLIRASSYIGFILLTLITLNLGRLFNVQLPWLDNLNNIMSIVSAIVTILLAKKGIEESTS
jgi:hypothetical protein